MEHLELYESFNQRTMILRHKMSGEITVELQGSQIKEVVNGTNIRFPFNVGSNWNRSIETWACNNKFKTIETLINGRLQNSLDPCPEEKIFGIRKKDIPMGHELRMLYPNKFRN
jgi:hypothetical protein